MACPVCKEHAHDTHQWPHPRQSGCQNYASQASGVWIWIVVGRAPNWDGFVSTRRISTRRILIITLTLSPNPNPIPIPIPDPNHIPRVRIKIRRVEIRRVEKLPTGTSRRRDVRLRRGATNCWIGWIGDNFALLLYYLCVLLRPQKQHITQASLSSSSFISPKAEHKIRYIKHAFIHAKIGWRENAHHKDSR